MNTTIKIFDNIIATIEAMILTVLTRLGAYLCAAVPGSFTALSIYNLLSKSDLAWYLGLMVAMSWESAGIIVTKQAIELWTRYEQEKTGRGKLAVMIVLTLVYMLGVAGVVLATGEAFPTVIKTVGALSPVLTVSVYIANAIRLDIAKVEVKQDALEADNLAWEREKERLEMQYKQEAKLARIEAKKRPIARPIDRTELDESPENLTKLDGANRVRLSKKEENLDAVLQFLDGNPDASLAEIGRYVGRSKSTAENYVSELMDAGRLVKNGHGYEVRR